MDDPLEFCPEEIQEAKEALENNDAAAAAAKIQEYLEKQNNIPLNIAITGESGSGKSTFVNVLRGITDGAEGAAGTGPVETTMEVTSYPHPNYPNVTFWDLPGIGTTNFPADKYLEHVGFEKFDFFIIISDTRFTENDVKLSLEIQKMGKKFYFVRSKIDNDLYAEKRKPNFNEETTLKQIREDCIQGLQQQGLEAPKVFLVSSFELHLYDFHLLEETLEKELPAHKRDALLFAMPNVNLEIINKKKKAFQAKIKYHATLSAAVAGVPVPGLSIAVDLSLLVGLITQYVVGFRLDIPSLKRLAATADVPLSDLLAVIVSPLAAIKITTELILKVLTTLTRTVVAMTVEEGSRFIPLLGIPIAMAASFTTTYSVLNTIINTLADDAQNVFNKALGLDTSV